MHTFGQFLFYIILFDYYDMNHGSSPIFHHEVIITWIQRVTQTNSMVVRLENPEKTLVNKLIRYIFLEFGSFNQSKESEIGTINFVENKNQSTALEQFVLPKNILVIPIKSGLEEK